MLDEDTTEMFRTIVATLKKMSAKGDNSVTSEIAAVDAAYAKATKPFDFNTGGAV